MQKEMPKTKIFLRSCKEHTHVQVLIQMIDVALGQGQGPGQFSSCLGDQERIIQEEKASKWKD